MDRYNEILKYVCPNESETELFQKLIAEYVEIEKRLDELRKLPFIKVHPKDPAKQKATPAAKQYKELLQQYTNITKILARQSGGENVSEDSPLRDWARRRLEKDAD